MERRSKTDLTASQPPSSVQKPSHARPEDEIQSINRQGHRVDVEVQAAICFSLVQCTCTSLLSLHPRAFFLGAGAAFSLSYLRASPHSVRACSCASYRVVLFILPPPHSLLAPGSSSLFDHSASITTLTATNETSHGTLAYSGRSGMKCLQARVLSTASKLGTTSS